MKKMLIMLLAAVSTVAMAQQVKVGDIVNVEDVNYRVTSLEPALMEVTESPFATGDIEIYGELEHYDVVYKVVKIGSLAFYNGTDYNPEITGVVIPEGVEEIGYQAFFGCSRIAHIHLPSTLKIIGNSAFYCFEDYESSLEEVTCDAVVPPTCGHMVWGSTFNKVNGISRHVPCNVPKGSVQAYRNAYGWTYFAYITDGEETSEIDVPDEEQGIEDIDAYVGLDITKPMYDVLGKQVEGDYKGIVIQNGRKYIK